MCLLRDSAQLYSNVIISIAHSGTGLLLGLHVMTIAALSKSKKAALELHRRGVIV